MHRRIYRRKKNSIINYILNSDPVPRKLACTTLSTPAEARNLQRDNYSLLYGRFCPWTTFCESHRQVTPAPVTVPLPSINLSLSFSEPPSLIPPLYIYRIPFSTLSSHSFIHTLANQFSHSLYWVTWASRNHGTIQKLAEALTFPWLPPRDGEQARRGRPHRWALQRLQPAQGLRQRGDNLWEPQEERCSAGPARTRRWGPSVDARAGWFRRRWRAEPAGVLCFDVQAQPWAHGGVQVVAGGGASAGTWTLIFLVFVISLWFSSSLDGLVWMLNCHICIWFVMGNRGREIFYLLTPCILLSSIII